MRQFSQSRAIALNTCARHPVNYCLSCAGYSAEPIEDAIVSWIETTTAVKSVALNPKRVFERELFPETVVQVVLSLEMVELLPGAG